jgi:hypothetical protein
MANLDGFVLVRWMDEGTGQCVRDDGVRDFDLEEFAQFSNVFVTVNLGDAQRVIENELRDMLHDPMEEDEEPLAFRWEREGDTHVHYLFNHDEIEAVAVVTPLQDHVIKPEGPQ